MKKLLIDRVIESLEDDVILGDTTVLEELLGFIPDHLLRGALPEEEWKNWPLPEVHHKAARNQAIIDNFILFATHCSDEMEPAYTEQQSWTPEELYRTAYDYIEEDHVDGKQSPDTI